MFVLKLELRVSRALRQLKVCFNHKWPNQLNPKGSGFFLKMQAPFTDANTVSRKPTRHAKQRTNSRADSTATLVALKPSRTIPADYT